MIKKMSGLYLMKITISTSDTSQIAELMENSEAFISPGKIFTMRLYLQC